MINRVVIVGGGTAGWITATLLEKKCANVEIVLIDKEVSTPVAVGEATLLGFDTFMNVHCGFNQNEWVPETDAVPKASILFPGWGNGKVDQVWHPFYFPLASHDVPLCDALSHTGEDVRNYLPLYDSALRNEVDLENQQAYSWHIDATKLVKFLERKLKQNTRLIHLQKEVVEVKHNTEGEVERLILEDNTYVDADLYVDCTGLKSILKIERDRVDLKGRLFVDTAVAGHVPYADRDTELKPYTICKVVDSGWLWDTSLQSRIGSGLVFNRSITDIDQAKEELCNYWGDRIKPDDLRVIDWSPYYDRNQWEKNVVSVGLSAGFVEPLESTGIALIIEGANQLSSYVRGRFYNQFDINSFNTYMIHLFETGIDFVSMHYDLSTRQSPFWEFVRETYQRSDQLNIYIDNMKSNTPSIINGKPGMFGGSNWIYWMIQLGYDFIPKNSPDPLFARRSLDQYNEFKSQTPNNIVKLNGMTMDDLIVKPIPIFDNDCYTFQ